MHLESGTAIKKHFCFFVGFQNFVYETISKGNFRPLFWEEDHLFKLQFSDLLVRHYYTRKDTMTSVTQRAVCEHSLLIMQNMPHGLFSMQHGSFELSDSQTRVLLN